MRYLWVEDFNDEGLGNMQEELQDRLEGFFDLENDKLIVKKTLSDAIEFLENKKNQYAVDAILLDIRFPEDNGEGIKGNLYKEFFRDIITEKFYKENINDASGIILYLLLVFRYHIPQNKIVFISANISNDNAKLKYIQEMIEIIIKSKYEELSPEDKMRYLTDEWRLGKFLGEMEKGEEQEWPEFIAKDKSVKNDSLDEAVLALKKISSNYRNKFQEEQREDYKTSAQMKYNFVKNQFEEIGFIMPSAFEKPKAGGKNKKSYLFLDWEENLYSDVYNAVRSNILEMCIIIGECLNHENSEPLYTDFLQLLTCDEEEKKLYNKDFFLRYLENVKSLFLIECSDNMEVFCERVLKEITSLWEASALPKVQLQNTDAKRTGRVERNKGKTTYIHNDNCFYACHAVMKMVRNWCGHQGIKNVNLVDVGLVFVLNMRGIFNIANDIDAKEKMKYEEYENKLLALFKTGDDATIEIEESLDYFCRLNNATKEGNNESRTIYDKISGLGHAKSKIRQEVSMDEIYMLLYHILAQENCYDIYDKIKKQIELRTWKEWRNRYNQRFQVYTNA